MRSFQSTLWCFYPLRKRRRPVAGAPGTECLESRQFLAADVAALIVGPQYIHGEPSDEMGTTGNASAPIGSTAVEIEIDTTPLPPGWQPRSLPPRAANAELHPLSEIPVLNSYLASPVSLYLDFNGHFQEDWGSEQNISTPTYSLDDDFSTFSDEELSAIETIFARVAEDFAPFAINVTTVEPSGFENGQGLRIAIGGKWEDWFRSKAGGVGLIDSFTDGQPNVAYVFSETLDDIEDTAEAVSHEAGHSFGLRHQSSYDEGGRRIAEYYGGDTTGAPIMGVSYSSVRGRWWLGTSTSQDKIQDDLAQLSREENGFGYRPDDHGGTLESATTIELSDSGTSVTGLIEQMDDVDVFRFEIEEADQYRFDYRAALLGANLDAHLELRAADGTLLDERTTFHENTVAMGRSLEPGTYQLIIQSDGTYGSLGHYTLKVKRGTDPTLPPTSPTHFQGTYLTPSTAEFTWVDAVDETSYTLHATRKVDKKLYSFLISLPADVTSYTLTDHGILDGWQFYLEARNSIGSTATDGVGLVDIPVTAPQNVHAVLVSANSAAILWDAVPSARDYLVRVRTVTEPGTTFQSVVVDAGPTETILTGLQGGISYLINVIARNSLGDVEQLPITVPIPIDPVPAPISAPTIGTSSANDPFVVHLAWSEVSGATLYQVQQRQGKQWITVQMVPGTTQTVNVLPRGDQLRSQYRIVASNGTSTVTSKPVKVRRPPPVWQRHQHS